MAQIPRLDSQLERLLPETSELTATGELSIGGCSVTELAEKFGTPAYVYDESEIRQTMRRYSDLLAQRWPHSRVCFASKSLPCAAAYAMAQEEGLLVDVAGEGELRMALAAGVDPKNILLHGNAKSASEIELAITNSIRLIVIDNETDISLIRQFATSPQDVLIRVIPDIDARTHPSIATGGRTSKFGLGIDRVRELVVELEHSEFVNVRGVHVHVGSQIMDIEPFVKAVEVLGNIGDFDIYNLGGGLGVNYSSTDDAPALEDYIGAIAEAAARILPEDAEILIEPGRSLVARSGVSLYTVRNVKATNATFVAVDGGMSDQMGIALTDDHHTAVIAERASSAPDTQVQLVGRQCESGDLLVDRSRLNDPRRGDRVVLAATGAYGYTFVNNYNGALHPPVVFCSDGASRAVVSRQTLEQFFWPHAAELARLGRTISTSNR